MGQRALMVGRNGSNDAFAEKAAIICTSHLSVQSKCKPLCCQGKAETSRWNDRANRRPQDWLSET